MHYNVISTNAARHKSDCLIIGVFADNQFAGLTDQLDAESIAHIKQVLKNGDLTDEVEQSIILYQVPNIVAERILLIGCGKEDDFNEHAYRKVITKAASVLKVANVRHAAFLLATFKVLSRDTYWTTRQAIELIENTLYNFSQFKTQQKSAQPKLQQVSILVVNKQEVKISERALEHATSIAVGMQLARDLGNLPANVCTPTYLAQQAQKLAKDHQAVRTTIHDEKQMKKWGMGALLSVARGSHEPAKLIVMEYQGSKKIKQPIVLVGKGITFDSGGLSLKAPTAMEEMKFDMCGAATVFGVIKAIAAMSLPINVVAVIPATENLPGGNASKPGDIVKTMSGQTVEIMNTDAEGRLILCDALTFAERFKPKVVIDIATLTGAIIISLGNVASGLFGNDDELIQQLQQAGNATSDRVWPMPLWNDYQEQINSNIADMMNIGLGGGKSITAACFLARFTKNYKWAHLDVAGTAWNSGKDKLATGRPVPLLVEYLLNQSH